MKERREASSVGAQPLYIVVLFSFLWENLKREREKVWSLFGQNVHFSQKVHFEQDLNSSIATQFI